MDFVPIMCRNVLHPNRCLVECEVQIFVFTGIKKSSRIKQKPKEAQSVTTDKEHVNVVFIGHVGELVFLGGGWR